jgi:hypothetical protein
LTALRFYASGSYQQDIGENRASSMSQSAVSQCLSEVTEALNQPTVFNAHVYFPRSIEELNVVRQKYNYYL